MNTRLIDAEVGFDLAGYGTIRGRVQTYRQIGPNRFAVTAVNDQHGPLTGVVDVAPDGAMVATVIDEPEVDRIARAILDGRSVRAPIGRQMHALAAAWLSRRGATTC